MPVFQASSSSPGAGRGEPAAPWTLIVPIPTGVDLGTFAAAPQRRPPRGGYDQPTQ
jgi:hypothetical protein